MHRVVEYLKQFGEPQYEEGILDGPAADGATQDLFGDAPDAEADPLYDEAVAFVVRTRRASISSVQRQLRIGYNRAARLVEQMEAAGPCRRWASTAAASTRAGRGRLSGAAAAAVSRYGRAGKPAAPNRDRGGQVT